MKFMKGKKIAVIGAGGWGTALSILLSGRNDVLLWCFEKETVDEIEMNRTNADFLPGIELPNNIQPISDFNEIKDIDIIVNTVPTQFIRSVYSQVNFSFRDKIIINGAKGIEKKTFKRISEIFTEITDISSNNYVVLSGPSHAEEVAKSMATAVSVASSNLDLAKSVRDLFSTENFRAYSSDDVVGCELGGALKNIIAIAAGIVDGLGLGDNTKAALITRGVAEIARLGSALGANMLTFSGLSGLGDLIVTCTSRHSRNRKVGELIGQGVSMYEIIHKNKMVAEGIDTAESAYLLSQKIDVELPIVEQVYNIIYADLPVREGFISLMQRENKHEIW